MDPPPPVPDRIAIPPQVNGKFTLTDAQLRSLVVTILIMTDYVIDQYKTCGKDYVPTEMPDAGL